MDESARLRALNLDELATEMGGVQEETPKWSMYIAEFKRREHHNQNRSSRIAICSVVISAIAIVAGSTATVVEKITTIHPPAVDLTIQEKPRLKPEDLNSDKMLTEYDIALETWGEAGWQQVARLCRYHREMGLEIECPSPQIKPRRF